MKLFTSAQYSKLLDNGKPENQDKDHKPVVKLFTPDAGCTWLITEIHDLDTAFGLCDLGQGIAELGYIHIPELAALRGRLGLAVERDLSFMPKFTIMTYARAAWHHKGIIEDETILAQFVK